jgi:hypothetical protein
VKFRLPTSWLALCLAGALGGHAGAQMPPAARPALAPVRASGPTWMELNASQRQALAPLAGQWNQLSDTHKRKWLAVAQSFSRLPPAEQATMHSRMTEWVALSPQQRSQARLNFAEAQQLSQDDKKAKWEAYQALSPEERRKLAKSAGPRPPTTAAPVRPVPPQKLAATPKTSPDAKPARIAVKPPSEAPARSAPAPEVAVPAPTP